MLVFYIILKLDDKVIYPKIEIIQYSYIFLLLKWLSTHIKINILFINLLEFYVYMFINIFSHTTWKKCYIFLYKHHFIKFKMPLKNENLL